MECHAYGLPTESRRSRLEKLCDDAKSDYFVDVDDKQQRAIPEDGDEDLSAGIFRAFGDARWHKLQASAKKPEIGKIIDCAMELS